MPTGWTLRNSIVLNEYLATGLGNRVIGAHIADSGSVNWRFAMIALPGSTYTVIATLVSIFQGYNSSTWGLYVGDGTKYVGIEVLDQAAGSGGTGQLRVQRLTDVNTPSTTIAGPTANLIPSTATFKITQDVTNRTFYYYSNGAFTQFFQEAAGSFLTETEVGFGGLSVAGSTAVTVEVQLIDWSLT